ncbi:Zn-ribbon containing protein [Haloferax sp. S1W]|uniref:OapC/ArvC family zinc-ribbon domain-containing protein n=1 Tax=Haloferax sp. S1W TaxID=3377110 RepID=UPI0037C4FB19
MPHQCTTCGKVFPDGSKEMLSGCPSCGGNKFQFQPASTASDAGSADGSDNTGSPGSAGTQDLTSSAADAVRRRAAQNDARPNTEDEETTVQDWVSSQTQSTRDSAPEPERQPPQTRTSDRADPRRPATDDKPERGWGEWPSQSGNEPEPASARENRPDAVSSTGPDPNDRSPARRTDRPNRGIRARTDDEEDNSQRSARSDVVSPEELAAVDESRREKVDHPQRKQPEAERSQRPEVERSQRPEVERSQRPEAERSQRPEAERSQTQPPAADTPADAPVDGPDDPPIDGPADTPSDTDGTVIEPSTDERPNLDQLREELNDQFESIKIVNPGQYELNLMELYDRDEYIISLREDGRYVIEVPDSWGPGERDD